MKFPHTAQKNYGLQMVCIWVLVPIRVQILGGQKNQQPTINKGGELLLWRPFVCI